MCALNLSVFEVDAQGSARSMLTKVVIDAGHGGKDPGAKGKLSMEKDITLAVALKLGKLISDNHREVKVIYTRETDVFIPLDVRSSIANKSNANLFISIHANSNRSSVPYGSETYVMGLHKSADNFEVAATENSAIVLEDNYNSKYEGFNPKSAESYIIFSMMQSKFLDHSLQFAQHVQHYLSAPANRTSRGVKQAGFLVLWRTAMPSVLVELGFISNAKDEQYMVSEEGQSEMAESIYKAFRAYKASYEMKNFVEKIDEGGDIIYKDSTNVSKSSQVVKPTDDSEKDATQNEAAGIILKIQIAGSRGTPLTKKQKKQLEQGFEEIAIDGVYKYCVGSYSSFAEANAALKELRRRYKDAFVVAFEDGKLLNINEAQKRLGK